MAETGDPKIREADRGIVMTLVAGVPMMEGYVWARLDATWDDNL